MGGFNPLKFIKKHVMSIVQIGVGIGVGVAAIGTGDIGGLLTASGLIMSGVGGITGVKELQTAGMVLMGIGAVTSIVGSVMGQTFTIGGLSSALSGKTAAAAAPSIGTAASGSTDIAAALAQTSGATGAGIGATGAAPMAVPQDAGSVAIQQALAPSSAAAPGAAAPAAGLPINAGGVTLGNTTGSLTPGQGVLAPTTSATGSAGVLAPVEAQVPGAIAGAVPGASGTGLENMLGAGAPQPIVGGASAQAANPLLEQSQTTKALLEANKGVSGAGVVTGNTPTDTPPGLISRVLNSQAAPYLAITVGQGVAGFAEGWFQGQSADEQMKFQKRMYEEQRTNRSYAPSI